MIWCSTSKEYEVNICSNENIRQVTQINRHGEMMCLLLEEDDVVPSFYWIDPEVFRSFRDQFAMSRNRFCEVMFGERKSTNFFHQLIGKIKGVQYDFRVTPFTRDRIIYTVHTLFETGKERLQDSEYVAPDIDVLFSAKPNVGLGAYNRTKALAIAYGNQIKPFRNQDKVAIDGRINEFFLLRLHQE